ncbi:MAG TPA: radical SAM protein [Candidatus Pacearchaeota archaeon]|jgi:DNA repair photolyase|nr:radical SAM protein [Candidatus Pacearchaeota archaeon]
MKNDAHVIKPKVNKNIRYIGEKLIVNPYYGCAHQCLFCPANDGYLKKKVFEEFLRNGSIFVVENIVDHVDAYIQNAKGKEVTVHLSPVTDPFQPIEKVYHLTLKIMKYCSEKNIPMAICTKAEVPNSAFPYLKAHPKSFVQVSLPSINEKKRRFIVRGGGLTVRETLKNIGFMIKNGILVMLRIDPIYPFINDDMEEFEALLIESSKIGVTYVLSSIADIYYGALEREFSYLEKYQQGLGEKYQRLYQNEIQGRFHADIGYRKKLFENMSRLCEKHQMYFGITWEPDLDGNNLGNVYNYGADRFFETREDDKGKRRCIQ